MKRFAACVLGAGFVLGMTEAARADEPPRIVRVYVAGSAEAVSGSRDAVQELCARSNVAVVVHDAAGADEALLSTANERSLAEAYIDLRPEMPARVVVVDGDTHQELERRNLPQNTTLEISIQTAAHIVCAAVDSSLAARVPPVPAPVVAAPAPVLAPSALHRASTPPGPARPSDHGADRALAWQSSIALFAATEDFGAGFRAGLGGSVSFLVGRGHVRGGGLITLQGYPGADVETNAASAGFESFGGRIGPMLEWQALHGASLFAALGLGADRSKLDAHQAAPGTVAQATPATTDGVAAGLIGVRLQLSQSAGILLGLDADVALSRRRYVLATDHGIQPFFQASRVRPLGLLGFSWSFDGAGSAPRELSGAGP